MKYKTFLISMLSSGKSPLLFALLISSALCIKAQQTGTVAEAEHPGIIALSNSSQNKVRSSEILRVINDPGGHAIWLLSTDPVYPSGPGRLERIPLTSTPHRTLAEESPTPRVDEVNWQITNSGSLASSPSELASVAPAPNLTPVIRAGDRIIIEQHSAILDSTLAAIALGPARLGAQFDARLVVGGKHLHAIALASGRAIIASEQERSGFGGSQ